MYVPTLVRARRLRPLDGSAGIVSVFSSLSELEETLTPSPMVVGGVEDDDCALIELSTVMALSTDSEGDARVTPSRVDGGGIESILSRRVENIVASGGRVA